MAQFVDRSTQYATKIIRWAGRLFFSVLWLACFFAFFLLNGPPRVTQQPSLSNVAHYVLPPFHVIRTHLPTVYYGYDFSPLFGVFVILALSTIVYSLLDRWDATLAQRQVKPRTGGAAVGAAEGEEVDDKSQRTRLLEQVAQAKKALTQMQKRLAFLSIDVVGSTRMKVGEDKLLVEHAFVEYRRVVEKILTKYNVWKASWTPDGIMACFFDVQNATDAARELLEKLKWFNSEVSQLQTPLRIRCGLNAGEVMFPATSAVEEVSDETIDLAGHLQKEANPDSIWVTATLHEQLRVKDEFRPVEQKKVDGHAVFEWKVAEQTEATAAPSSSTH